MYGHLIYVLFNYTNTLPQDNRDSTEYVEVVIIGMSDLPDV